jgi:hypothetical protein
MNGIIAELADRLADHRQIIWCGIRVDGDAPGEFADSTLSAPTHTAPVS